MPAIAQLALGDLIFYAHFLNRTYSAALVRGIITYPPDLGSENQHFGYGRR
jgi:hypothetical protein